MRIALWNASGLDNIGDRLLDHVNRQELIRRLPRAIFQTFTPWPSTSMPTVAIDSQGRWSGEGSFDAVIIGGGALLIGPPFIHPSLQTCYLGPYPERFRDRCPIVWNAICCDAQFVPLLAEPWRNYVRSAGDRVSYVTVRNLHTAEFLSDCGVAKVARVVPDPVTLLHQPRLRSYRSSKRRRFGLLLGASGRSASFLSYLLGNDHDSGWNPLVRAPAARELAAEQAPSHDVVTRLIKCMASIARLNDIEVAPFGMVYSDELTATRLADELACRKVDVRDPLGADVFDWMTSLDCVIASRLHACVLALVAGTPFVAVDPYFNAVTGTSKVHGFMVSAGLEGLHIPLGELLNGNADLEQAIECAMAVRNELPDIHARLAEAASGHFDDLVSRLVA